MAFVSHRVTFLGVIILASLAFASAEARQFRSSDVLPLGSPAVEGVLHIAELFAQRTGGRHHITVEHGEKVSENYMLAQVRTGMLDMARLNVALFNSSVPATTVLSLPFLFRSTGHMRRVLDGPIGQQILAGLEDQDVIGLCFYDMGARSFYSRKEPIRHVDDMKGLAVRVQPGDLSAEMVKAMGGKPMAMPFDRVAAGLKAGVVDASENGWQTYVGAGHHLLARHYSLTRHSRAPGVVVVSKKAWRELTPDDRDALRTAARESVLFMRRKLDTYEVSARREAESSGVAVLETVDRKSFADVLVPLYPSLVRDPALGSLIRQVQADAEASAAP